MQILKLALAAGRIVGLPLPCVPQMPDLINQAEREAVAQLEGFMADAMGELKDECEAEFEAAMDLDGEPVPGVSAEKAKGVTGASFRALRALLEKQVPQYGQSAASATMSSAPAPPQGAPGGSGRLRTHGRETQPLP